MGIAALFMPAISGIIADRWINAEKLLALSPRWCCYIMLFAPGKRSGFVLWVILAYMIFYMPTLALANSVSYTVLKSNNLDIKSFPPIRMGHNRFYCCNVVNQFNRK